MKATKESDGEKIRKELNVDVNKMVDKFAHTEVKGYGVPSMIEVDAYRRGIEDALKYCLTTIQIYERDKNSKTT